MGRWQCGLEILFDPLDGWQIGVELKSKAQSNSVRRLEQYTVRTDIWAVARLEAIRAEELQAKTSNNSHGHIKINSVSMQHSIWFLLWTKNSTTVMVTRLAIHPGEAKVEWMTITVAFTQCRASITTFEFQTTQAHPCLKHIQHCTRGRSKHKGLLLSDFPYVGFTLHVSTSHIKSQDLKWFDTTSDRRGVIEREWETEECFCDYHTSS